MSTLEWVRNGLDDTDPATLTAVPVLVIAESGGAASDIYRYCCPESETYLELPTVDGRRDAEYVAACARLLPEIEELGKQTGANATKQMNFFVIDPDPEADNDTDLVLAIQTALLNDCPDINQEAMLAVAWGQAVILQRHLESDAANLLAPTASEDDDKPPPDDLLQIALQHKDVNVVQTLLDFSADPTHVVLDELFKEEFDRYPLPETKGLWLKPKVRKRPKLGMPGGSPPKAMTSPGGVTSPGMTSPEAKGAGAKAAGASAAGISRHSSRALLDQLPTVQGPSSRQSGKVAVNGVNGLAGKATLDAALAAALVADDVDDRQPSRCAKLCARFSSVGGLNRAERLSQRQQAWPGAAHAQQVLDRMVDGYATHLNARKALVESGGTYHQPQP